MSIRRGDQVVVISGKDKGKTGKVLRVEGEGKRVVVDGVNIVIKHKKARNAKQKSTREKRPSSIDISIVMIMCKCGKATRIAHKIDEKGVKHRVCAKCGEVLDKKFVKMKEKTKEADEVKEKDEEKTEKKPLQRRESRFTAESKVKSQVSGGASAHVGTTIRKTGGGA